MVFIGRADISIWSPENAFTPTKRFNPTNDGTPTMSNIGLALYQSLWAYDGWNLLNYVAEELKKPEKNMPRALIIAMSSVMVLYILLNISYLSVLGPEGLLNADAVAAALANSVFVGLDRVISIMVASSVFGTCLVSCFTAARVPYVAAREGQFPEFLSMIHITNATPVPAVLWNGTIATLLIFPNDFNSLVNYFSFCMWIFHVSTFATLLWLRRTMPVETHPRLFKVPTFIPFVVIIIGLYLIFVPFMEQFDWGYVFAVLWIFGGVALYMLVQVNWFRKKFQRVSSFVTRWLQIIIQVLPAEA